MRCAGVGGRYNCSRLWALAAIMRACAPSAPAHLPPPLGSFTRTRTRAHSHTRPRLKDPRVAGSSTPRGLIHIHASRAQSRLAGSITPRGLIHASRAHSRLAGSFTRRWPRGRSAADALVRACARPQPPAGVGLQARRKAPVVEEEGTWLALAGLLDALPCRQAGAGGLQATGECRVRGGLQARCRVQGGLQAGQHGRGRCAPTRRQTLLPVPCPRRRPAPCTLLLAPRPLAARTSPPCTLYPPCVQAVGCRM